MNASELWKEILNNPATKKTLLKDIESSPKKIIIQQRFTLEHQAGVEK